MMVTKPCPKCQQHLPVACKACPCGHVFFVARRPVSIHKVGRIEEGEVKRRRTERTKRERPNYFNSLQIENELKKMKSTQKSRKRADNSASSNNNDKECDGSNSEDGGEVGARGRSSLNTKHKKRGRPKKTFPNPDKDSKNEEKEEEDMFANISKERETQFSIILEEINRKMFTQKFQM